MWSTTASKLIFGLGLATAAAQIWAVPYFLTLDGPCHLYNAQILLDGLMGRHTDFYGAFYELNAQPEPNWFSHLTLVPLLALFPAWLAEKIWLTGYVLLFGFGMRKAVRALDRHNDWLATGSGVLAMHLPLYLGFFNYCTSLALVFYVFAQGLSYWRGPSLRNGVLLCGLVTWQYFCHPVGLTVGGVLLGLACLGVWYDERTSAGRPLFSRDFFPKAAGLALAYVPAAILLADYLRRKGIGYQPNPDTLGTLLQALFRGDTFAALDPVEEPWAGHWTLLQLLMLGLGLMSFFWKPRTGPGLRTGLLLGTAAMFAVYFVQPGGLTGGGVVSVRLQVIPWLAVWLLLASGRFDNLAVRWLMALAILFLSGALAWNRLPALRCNSEAVAALLDGAQQIPPRSTVLYLPFDRSGCSKDGYTCSPRVTIFGHALGYLGTTRPLILLDNYEGNTHYFPLNWRDERNPFLHLGFEIEYPTPDAKLSAYPVPVDYILLWCADDTQPDSLLSPGLFKGLQTYQLLDNASGDARCRLYALDGLSQQ
jgi:hypothetical protein